VSALDDLGEARPAKSARISDSDGAVNSGTVSTEGPAEISGDTPGAVVFATDLAGALEKLGGEPAAAAAAAAAPASAAAPAVRAKGGVKRSAAE
jgi:hypothetical protein